MINIGARFDDRITGRPRRLLAVLEEDPRRHRPVSINKNVKVESASRRLRQCPRDMLHGWRARAAARQRLRWMAGAKIERLAWPRLPRLPALVGGHQAA
jgi:hypothetical protein